MYGNDMTPDERAKVVVEELDDSYLGEWPSLIATAIRDAENGIAMANDVTMPNRPAPESGRSMTFRCHRRGRYIV